MASYYNPSDSGQRAVGVRVPGRAMPKAALPHSPKFIRGGRAVRSFSKVHPSTEPYPSTSSHERRNPFVTDPLITSPPPPVFLRQSSPQWDKKASWVRLGDAAEPPVPAVGSLVTAGVILLLSGSVSCLLCFYGLSQGGRRYYLDFGLIAGFSSILIGSLGIRARSWHRAPNRNYTTGYIVLGFFSVLTTTGLVILNFAGLQNSTRSGYVVSNKSNPILDLVGGAECGIAVLSLAISVAGLILLSSSRGGTCCCLNCCGDPPPDDRVAHRAEGFTL